MEELGLVGDLAVVATAALVGGVVARLLRLPAILGYLAAGFLIGPNTPGPSGDIEDVRTIADLGVALLMFTLGIQFSVREVVQYRGIALGGGIGVTIALLGVGLLAGLAFDLSTKEAVVTGMAVSVSSSMVALRLLDDRALIGAPPGRLAIVISLVQDLAVIFMLTLVPVLSGNQDDLAQDLGWALLKAGGLLIGLLFVGTFVLPRIFRRVAISRARELFLLLLVTLALGTATLSAEMGLSVAFGAFLGGLLISESEYAHRSLAEILPLREVFAVVFFVAIGMLIEPSVFQDRPELVFGIAGIAVAAKILLLTAVSIAFRYPLRYALTAALSLAAMGEFSFVITNQALDEQIIDNSLNEAILASVLLTMLVAPVLFVFQDPVLAFVRGLPVLGRAIRQRSETFVPEDVRLVNHAIVVGYTQAGRGVAASLAARGFRYVVIDEDPATFRALKKAGTPVILGDASLPAVLEAADIERSRVLVITSPDPGLVESIAATARQLNRRLDIIARAITDEGPARLRELGVARVVEAEFEVGQEFVRHTLQRFGMTSQEIQVFLTRVRRDRLGETEADRSTSFRRS